MDSYCIDYRNIKTQFSQINATLELLTCSILVSISGALRIYLSSLLLQVDPSIVTCFAGGLVIYSIYTLDRSLDSEEDIINRTELSNSKKSIGLAASSIAFIIGSCILAKERLLALAFVPLVSGYLYSKGIKIGRFTLKLKGGLGIKNLVVGLSWGIFIVGLTGSKSILPMIIVFLLYGVKVYINSAIDDFKDIKGDTIAGIKTLPICLGELRTRKFLLGLHVLSHLIIGIALINGVIAYEPLVIAISFMCGLICILRYTNEDKYMSKKGEMIFLKDGESSLIIGLRIIADALIV